MTDVEETAGFGWSDEELLAYPLVYRPDLFAGKVALVSGGGSGLGKARIEALGGHCDSHQMTIRDPICAVWYWAL